MVAKHVRCSLPVQGLIARQFLWQDDVVLPSVSLALAPALAAEDVHVTLIKDGDHRLSRDEDLKLMLQTLGALLSSNAC